LPLRLVVLLLALLVATPCLVVGVARAFGGPAPLPQLAAFAPWTGPGWAVVLVLLVAGRWWWPVPVVLVLLLVAVAWVLPSAPAPPPHRSAPRLRVMTLNVLAGRADVDAVLRVVHESHVDLLAVQEGLPESADRLTAGLRERLPYVAGSDPEGRTGTRLWSRHPLEPIGPAFGEGHQIFQVDLSPGPPAPVRVRVTVVHTMSPGPGRIPGWTRDLRALRQASSAASGPQIMLGDFNATRDHRPFRRLLATGLADAADTVGTPPWRGATWPDDRRFPALLRLDHVLVTPGSFVVSSVRTVRIPGTDHRGLQADLGFAGPLER
jgi:endonuclease/exonuclease/phosphatase (EEP) superfamily protein YafD